MKATFIGVPGEQHDSILMYGQVFPLGEAVTVTSELGMRKLAKHPHFEAKADSADKAQDAVIEQELQTATAVAVAPVEEAHAAPVKAKGKGGRPKKA